MHSWSDTTGEYINPDATVSIAGDCTWSQVGVSVEGYVLGNSCSEVTGPAFTWVVSPTNVSLQPDSNGDALEIVQGGDNIGASHYSTTRYYVEMTDTNNRVGGGLAGDAAMF